MSIKQTRLLSLTLPLIFLFLFLWSKFCPIHFGHFPDVSLACCVHRSSLCSVSVVFIELVYYQTVRLYRDPSDIAHRLSESGLANLVIEYVRGVTVKQSVGGMLMSKCPKAQQSTNYGRLCAHPFCVALDICRT